MTSVSPRFAGTFSQIPLTTKQNQHGQLILPQFLDVVRVMDLRRAQYSVQFEAMAYEQDGAVYGAISTKDDDKFVSERLIDDEVRYQYAPGDSEMLTPYGRADNKWVLDGRDMRGPDKARAASEATARLYELA